MASRELKFRAWDRKAKAMFPVHKMEFNKITNELVRISGVDIHHKDSDWEGDASYGGEVTKMTGNPLQPKFVIMQYTGLKDKNGMEIYEGDILRFPPKDWREERDFIGYEVFYHDNDCADNHIGFQMNRLRFYGNLCGGECKAKTLPKYTSQMEIIGNIFEQGGDLTGTR